MLTAAPDGRPRGIDGLALGSGVLGPLHDDLDPAFLARPRRQEPADGHRPGVVVPLGTAQCGQGGPRGGARLIGAGPQSWACAANPAPAAGSAIVGSCPWPFSSR